MTWNEVNILSSDELDEILNNSVVVYKKILTKDTTFNLENIINKKIEIKNKDCEYFLNLKNKICKLVNLENDEKKLLVFSYEIENNNSSLKLEKENSFDTFNIFGSSIIRTKIESLDRRVVLQKGKLVIIASRPSFGKSSLITTIVNNNIDDYNMMVYSLQEKKDDFYIRLLSQRCSISLTNLVKNDLDDIEIKNIEKSYKEVTSKNLFIDDGTYTLELLVNKIKRDCIIKNLDIVFIDYLQLLKSKASLEYRYLELNQISRTLKNLAKELNILIIATSELNRNLESRLDKRPFLSDLRDSGTLEDDADIIMFIYRNDVYKERIEAKREAEAREKGEEYKSTFINKPIEEVEIIVTKQRNGTSGTVKLAFVKHITKFISLENEIISPVEIVFGDSVKKEKEFDIPDIL